MPGLASFKGLIMGSLAASAIAAPVSPRMEASLFKRFDMCNEGGDNKIYKLGQGFGTQSNGFGSCEAKYQQGILPRKIYAKADKDMLRFLRVSYTDGTNAEFGVENVGDDYKGTVEWNPYIDHFTDLSLNGNGWGGAVGRLVAATSNGQSMDAGAWDQPELNAVDRGAGGKGLLLGFKVNRGDGIDYLEPMFTKSKLVGTELRNAKFSPTFEFLNEQAPEERKIKAFVAGVTKNNKHSSSDGVMKINRSIDVQTQTSITNTKEKGSEIANTFNLEVNASMDFKVGGLGTGGEAQAGGSLGYSYTDTRVEKDITAETNGEAKTEKVEFTNEEAVKAGGQVTCRMMVLQTDNTFDVEHDLVWKFENGDEQVFQVTSSFKNQAISQGYIDCWDGAPGDRPEDLKIPVPVVDVGGAGADGARGELVDGITYEELTD